MLCANPCPPWVHDAPPATNPRGRNPAPRHTTYATPRRAVPSSLPGTSRSHMKGGKFTLKHLLHDRRPHRHVPRNLERLLVWREERNHPLLTPVPAMSPHIRRMGYNTQGTSLPR